MNCHEDNSAVIQVGQSGKNPSMKPLDRNPGISVGWIHEKIVEGSYNFIHTRTEHMAADIYTIIQKNYAPGPAAPR